VNAVDMHALEERWRPSRGGLVAGTPVIALGVLAVTWIVAVLVLPEAAARAVGLAAAHGALLGTALAWTADRAGRERWAPLQAALLLGAATACARLAPVGVLAYLAVPAWLLHRRGGWRGATGDHARAALAGGLFGSVLGLHLLVTASLTLGVRVRPGPAADLAAWLAYDVGANVLAAELFFRTALFTRAHRCWPFAAAAALSTATSIARYLVDPLLPRSVEILAGATFYLALLGAGNCWLLARHGSTAGPIAAALLFFAAYRLLGR
jgi:hypothetical protein